MAIPLRGALTSGTAVQVTWSAFTSGSSNAGGATTTIISYHLQWDAGNSASSSWLDLQGLSPTSTALSFLRTAGITGGLTYRFRVRARNKYGYGSFSDVLTVVTALAPTAPSTVTTAQEVSNVKISWAAPTANGVSVSEYQILIRKKDGSYASTATCLGSSAAVVTNRYCYVSFLTLRSDFGLLINDVVYARVRAYNSMGWSAYTENTSGATIKTEPSTPSTSMISGPATSAS
jgi:hypothetical protein